MARPLAAAFPRAPSYCWRRKASSPRGCCTIRCCRSSAIVLDEFHERSLHADLGIALARQAWLARDDLRLVVMSATIDPGPVTAFLGDCRSCWIPGHVSGRHRLRAGTDAA